MKALTRRMPLDLASPCLPWTGNVSPEGYGRIMIDGDTKYVHRLTYQLLVGPIPRGWEIDHVCHGAALERGECAPGPCAHRACRQPMHLEAVTSATNSERGGHPLFRAARLSVCRRGLHDLTDPANVKTVRVHGVEKRRCRPCENESMRRRRASA